MKLCLLCSILSIIAIAVIVVCCHRHSNHLFISIQLYCMFFLAGNLFCYADLMIRQGLN